MPENILPQPQNFTPEQLSLDDLSSTPQETSMLPAEMAGQAPVINTEHEDRLRKRDNLLLGLSAVRNRNLGSAALSGNPRRLEPTIAPNDLAARFKMHKKLLDDRDLLRPTRPTEHSSFEDRER